MAMVRLWALCPVASVALLQTALDALGAPFTNSMIGRFPVTSPTLAFAGWQKDDSLVVLVEAALGVVAGAHLFRGALWGSEGEAAPGVLQETDVTGATVPQLGQKFTRRACLKIVYGRLLLGAPPADAVANAAADERQA